MSKRICMLFIQATKSCVFKILFVPYVFDTEESLLFYTVLKFLITVRQGGNTGERRCFGWWIGEGDKIG